MNAKTLEAINRHGLALLARFPRATEKNPVALCKKLRRIETALAAPLLKNCNEGVPEAELDAITDKAVARVAALLGMTPAQVVKTGLHVNRDPRGYALKFSSEWTAAENRARYGGKTPNLYADWGGYGILAPNLNTK